MYKLQNKELVLQISLTGVLGYTELKKFKYESNNQLAQQIYREYGRTPK
jgi:hypothetical protein